MQNSDLILPYVAEWANPVWHLFVVRSKERDELQKYLKSNGIETSINYPIPIHLQEAYEDFGYKKGDFPIAEKIANEILSLPLWIGLTKEIMGKIIRSIKTFNNVTTV